MKKYFIKSVMNDGILFMTIVLVIFTPLWMMDMIKNGFNLVISFFLIMSYIYLINSYIRFNSEDWKRRKEINERFETLTIEDKERMITQFSK